MNETELKLEYCQYFYDNVGFLSCEDVIEQLEHDSPKKDLVLPPPPISESKEQPKSPKDDSYKKIKCLKCRYKTTECIQLARHYLKAHKPTLYCIKCIVKYKNRKTFTEHMLKNHRTMKCSSCKKQFSKQFLLIEHYKKAHPGINPYRCHRCSESFKNVDKCLNHIETCNKLK